MSSAIYITTPIYYVNANPHIGTAYTTLLGDVIARFKRLEGYKVKFVTGTDEHGQKIADVANRLDITPQKFVDEMSEKFRSLFQIMNINNDDFIRTTEKRHKKGVVSLWKNLYEKGDIYLGKYSGWYSIRDESFYSEKELINGKAPTGAEVTWISEESYFFKLSKWQDKLLEFYDKNPNFVVPKSRFTEIKKFVASGLRDLSISRTSFDWGIPVPGDSKHVMYVWLDALSNYLTVLGYPDNKHELSEFWPAIHLVGKDITKFHAIYWPAFLMSLGLELPKQIVSHGWWLNEGEKISKSLGNVIDPRDLISQYGLDQTRYYLLRDISFGNDGNFTYQSFVSRANSELANKLGNLVQRSLSMVYKNCDGNVPLFLKQQLEHLYAEEDILQNAMKLLGKIKVLFKNYEFNKVLEVIFDFIDSINAYIAKHAPWELYKKDFQKMQKILFVSLEAIRYALLLLIPFIPDSAHKLLDQIGVPTNYRNFNCLSKEFALKSQKKIEKPVAVFQKIELEV